MLPLLNLLLCCSGSPPQPAARTLAPTMSSGEVRHYLQDLLGVLQVLPAPKVTGKTQVEDLLQVHLPAVGGWRSSHRVVVSADAVWVDESEGLESLPSRLQAHKMALDLLRDGESQGAALPVLLVVTASTPAVRVAEVLEELARDGVSEILFVARPGEPPEPPSDPLPELARALREERAGLPDSQARAALVQRVGEDLANRCAPFYFASQEMSNVCVGESDGCPMEQWVEAAVPMLMECGRRTDLRELLVLWAATLPLTPSDSYLTRWSGALGEGGAVVLHAPGETWADLGPRLMRHDGQRVVLEPDL